LDSVEPLESMYSVIRRAAIGLNTDLGKLLPICDGAASTESGPVSADGADDIEAPAADV
jgi:hypothetical protein